MEDVENSADTSAGSYNKLAYHDDFSADEETLYSNQEKQQVSMSMVGPGSSLNHYKLLTVSLAVLAVILLAVDIGLGVYYNKLTGGQLTVMDIGSEVAKLQASYNTLVQRRDEVKNDLAKEIREQQLTKWEIDHQNKRSKDYKRKSDTIQMEIAAIKSQIPMIREGCRHCLPGWMFMNSLCYFFPFSDTFSRRTWQGARQFCMKQGGDLAVIDSRDKHLAVSEIINNFHGITTRFVSQSGYWIGLRDVEEEGTWKWLDGTRLTEGYWSYGEPNDQGGEDCAATYPRHNPFNAWNDAPCTYDLKWICQMAPIFSS